MSTTLAWIYLLIAAALEVLWAVFLKSTDGFTKWWPSVFVIGVMAVNIIILAQAVKWLPISTAYPVWVGIGAAGTVVFGVLFLAEPMTALKGLCIFLILAGTIGLKLLHA